MIPVMQTEFGIFEGNCWSACIASILELPIEAVPNFCSMSKHGDNFWLKRTFQWLSERKIGMLHIQNAKLALDAQPHLFTRCFVIITGRSPRAKEGEEDFLHAIVARCDTIENSAGYYTEFVPVHDPHIDKSFIVGDINDITLLIKN